MGQITGTGQDGCLSLSGFKLVVSPGTVEEPACKVQVLSKENWPYYKPADLISGLHTFCGRKGGGQKRQTVGRRIWKPLRAKREWGWGMSFIWISPIHKGHRQAGGQFG